jgi:hypothetical protein
MRYIGDIALSRGHFLLSLSSFVYHSISCVVDTHRAPFFFAGASHVAVAWSPSARNEPSRSFLFSIAGPNDSTDPPSFPSERGELLFAPATHSGESEGDTGRDGNGSLPVPSRTITLTDGRIVFASMPHGIQRPTDVTEHEWAALSKKAQKRLARERTVAEHRLTGLPHRRTKEPKPASAKQAQISQYNVAAGHQKPPPGMLLIPTSYACDCCLAVEAPTTKISAASEGCTLAVAVEVRHATTSSSGDALHPHTYVSIARAMSVDARGLRAFLERRESTREVSALEQSLLAIGDTLDNGEAGDTLEAWRHRYQGRQKLRHHLRTLLQVPCA